MQERAVNALVGQVWEYIEDGSLYVIIHDAVAEEADRCKLLDLQTGATPTVTFYAFSALNARTRWRRVT
jgi:hypothetical protein